MSGPANSGMPRGVDPPGHPMPTLDLSSFLDKVASELRPGQLLHTENFDLFQAMAAVVIGDPKMDAG